MYLSVVLSGFSELQIKLYINDEQAATFSFFFLLCFLSYSDWLTYFPTKRDWTLLIYLFIF